MDSYWLAPEVFDFGGFVIYNQNMTFISQAVFDKPLGLWLLDNTSPFTDYSGYSRAASVTGTPVKHASLTSGATYAPTFNSTLIAQFTSPVFVQNSEAQPFSLEAWAKPVPKVGTVAVQQVLSHTGIYDGLTVNGTVASFTTKYLTAPDAVASYDFGMMQNLHLVGIHTTDKNQLYLNGELVAEVVLTDVQKADRFVATDGKLYSGNTTGLQELALNGVAVYGQSLSATSVLQHYLAGTDMSPASGIPHAFDGDRIALSATDSQSYTWDDAEDWGKGYTTDLSTGDDLRPTFNSTNTSLAGTWLTVYPLDALPYSTVNGVNLFWNGTGATVAASLDGSTWETAVRGKNLTIVTPGLTTTGNVLHIRVTFAGGVLNDTSYLDNLTVVAQSVATLSAFSSRTVTLAQPAYPKFDYEPYQYRHDWGIELGAAGTITIGPDTASTPEHPRTVEIWVCKTTATDPTFNQTGTTYKDGVAGSMTFNVGQWTLVHIVTAANITGNIVITGPALVGHVAVYPTPLTAPQVAEIYTNYTGHSKVSVPESSLTVSEPASPVNIYGYEWGIRTAG